MQCDNCGYIFFQPSKKCTCCSAPYVPVQSSFDVGQENLFTIFEMAPGEGGIPGGMGMAGSTPEIDDYNFTDDFDAGGAEYGVDENVLDLSDAEAEGFGPGPVSEPRGADDFEFDTSAMEDMPSAESSGPDDFDLSLDADPAAHEATASAVSEPEADSSVEGMDFTGGFDEVEGLGFGFDESPAEETPEVTPEEISLDTDLEPEISLEPESEPAEEEPSLELSEEPELDMGDDQPSLELSEDLSEDTSMEIPEEDTDADEFNVVDEDASMELSDDLDLADEPELMEPTTDEYGDMDEDGGIDFDLDNVDLDETEEISYVGESEEEDSSGNSDEEPFMDLEGLEMETPEDPEDEDLAR